MIGLMLAALRPARLALSIAALTLVPSFVGNQEQTKLTQWRNFFVSIKSSPKKQSRASFIILHMAQHSTAASCKPLSIGQPR